MHSSMHSIASILLSLAVMTEVLQALRTRGHPWSPMFAKP